MKKKRIQQMSEKVLSQLKSTQHLSLNSELTHSLSILILGRLELIKFISLELEKNPCLSTKEYILKNTNNDVASFPDIKEALSLQTHILKQVSLSRLTPYEIKCVEMILQYIGDDGFLNTPLHKISEQNKIKESDLQFAIEAIQKCDPAGVGASGVQECLLIQLERIKKYPRCVENILQKHWIDFEHQDFSKIARSEKISVKEVKDGFGFIKRYLDPKPARQFGENINPFIKPDVYVFKKGDKWICSLNHHGLPRVQISKEYESILENLKKDKDKKSKDRKETVDFLKSNMKSAKWLIQCLKMRENTILKVTEVILKYQKDFFEYGPTHLVKLRLKDLAKQLKMHESTISRSTANKYLESPQGLFELKYFFNSSAEDDLGNQVTPHLFKYWISEYIKNENKSKPLSDEEISKVINKERRVSIARRTIAKYREELGVLVASKRKKIFDK
jgi:RNA polymerase sigma-54 factor